MSEELAIEILKQASIETTTGACENCPRKEKNKTCIGCLDDAKGKLLEQLQQKENIIKEVREYCLDKAKGRLERTLYDDILEILDKENKGE